MEPRKYQLKCLANFKDWIQNDERIGSIILPTGCGKTLSACLCLATQPHLKIIWIAHRQELIQQAYDCLKAVIPNARIEIEMAEQKASPEASIIVGSVQTLARQRKHLSFFTPDLIVIDEFHHVSKNNIQYESLITRFPAAKILGLSATPWRTSGEELPLGETLINMDIGLAVEKGYLVTPIPEPIVTDVSLADVKTKMGDFDVKQLSQAVNVDSRNQLIANKILELVKERKRQGVVFSVDVAHSKAMYQLLKNEVRAAEIYGETPKEERRNIIERVRNREIDVILNNLVLVEGWDAAHLSFVCVARPTRSLQLFIQAAGRGLRLFEDKKDCIIVDVFDKIKARQTRISFKDLEAHGDLKGTKKQAANLKKVKVETIAGKLVNFPIFIKKQYQERWLIDHESFPVTSWKLSDGHWLVAWTVNKRLPFYSDRPAWVPFKEPPNYNINNLQVKHHIYGTGIAKSVLDNQISVFFKSGEQLIHYSQLEKIEHIREEVPGEYIEVKTPKLFYICYPKGDPDGRVLEFEKDGSDLLLKHDLMLNKQNIDSYLTNAASMDELLPLVRAGAKWKNDPASEAQKSFIKGLNRKFSFDLDLDTLSKGDVSSLIEQMKWQEIILEKFGADFKEKLLGYEPYEDL